MIRVLLLFLVVCFGPFLSLIGRGNSSRPGVVNIGAILAFNTTIGRVAKVAIDAAVKDVNSDTSVLRSTELVIHVQDSNCNALTGIMGGLLLLETDVVAIVGPQSSTVAHVVAHLANEVQVPLVSFAATDPSLSSAQYPFFVRATQSDAFQMAAIAELVEYFQWREVIVIFTDDEYGRNGVADLNGRLAEKGCKISYKATLPPEANGTDICDVLIKVAIMGSRVFILHVDHDSGRKVFSVAHLLGMTTTGYAWIATDWLSSLLDSFATLDSEVINTMQGVLTLRQHTANNQRKRALVSKWRNLSKDDRYLQLNSYGLYAYDSVWMIAYALGAFFDDGGSIKFSKDLSLQEVGGGGSLSIEALRMFVDGNLLLKKIHTTVFDGVTGHVQFDVDGFLVHPAYDILNVVGTGTRRIGYWSNYSGLSIESPESLYLKPPNRSSLNQMLSNVIWPGQTSINPRGWVFPNNAQDLRIGVPYRASYPQFVSKDKGSDTMKGYCLDVFLAAVNLLPYPLLYRFIPFGNGYENPNYTELVEKVASNEFDAAVGDITIVAARTKIVDFTQPYIESGLVILASVREIESNAWAFLQPFSLGMWGVTGAFFIFIGAVIWILEHKFNDEFRGPPKKQLGTIFWFSFSTLFSSPKNTVSTLGRFVLLVWLFVILIVQSSYIASLTSILTVRQLYSPITGLESIIEGKDPIGYQVGSFSEKYLIEELGIPSSRLKVLHNPDEYARSLELGPQRGGVMAIVDELPYVELFMSTNCKFTIVGRGFTTTGWGFAFPRDSQLAIDMSTAILKLSESGDLQRIHDKWLTRSSCSSESTEIISSQLDLHSFWALFAICGVACFLALLAYFIKIIRQFIRYFPLDEPEPEPEGSSKSFGSKSGRILQSFISFADEKQEDKTARSRRRQAQSARGSTVDIETEVPASVN